MTPEQFRDRLIDLDREWQRVATLLDIAETRAHDALGKQPVMDDATTLALETALIPHRR